MSVVKFFNRTTIGDYLWLGARLNNSQYSQAYNEAVNALGSTINQWG